MNSPLHNLIVLAIAALSPVYSQQVQVSGVTTSQATVSWYTPQPGTSQVVFIQPSGDQEALSQTTETTVVTTTHNVTLSNLAPGSHYRIYVASKYQNGTIWSTKGLPTEFDTLPVNTAAPLDYRLVTAGPTHVYAGYTLRFLLSSNQLAGQPTHLEYRSVTGLGVGMAVKFNCRPHTDSTCLSNGEVPFQWLGTNGDGLNAIEPIVEVATSQNTPAGSYTLRITTQAATIQRSVDYTFTVLSPPVQPVRQMTSSAPPIPGFAKWEAIMRTLGRQWCIPTETFAFGWEQQVWYYDGARVFQMIADYTGDPLFAACAENVRAQYASFVIAQNGYVPGWRIFPHGMSMDYFRRGNTQNTVAVSALANNSPWATRGGAPRVELIRETSYLLQAYVFAARLGSPRHQNLGRAADYLLGQFDMIFSSQPTYQQLFYDGLAAEALIHYYELTADPRVPLAIKQMLDWVWSNAWNQTTKRLVYNPLDVPVDYANTMINLVAPAFAWYWSITGEAAYMVRGDELFSHALDDDISYSGKIFSQNYRTSFDYVRWRLGGQLSGTVPEANQSSVRRDFTLRVVPNTDPSSVTLTWSTPTRSTGQVMYGKVSASDVTQTISLQYVNDHSAVVSGLDPATTYKFAALSADASGNMFRSMPVEYTTSNRIPASVAFTSTNQETKTGDPFPPISVIVLDSQRLPVPRTAVQFQVTAGTGGAMATFSAAASASATTDSAGIATAPMLIANNIPGTITVTATVPGVPAARLNLQTRAATSISLSVPVVPFAQSAQTIKISVQVASSAGVVNGGAVIIAVGQTRLTSPVVSGKAEAYYTVPAGTPSGTSVVFEATYTPDPAQAMLMLSSTATATVRVNDMPRLVYSAVLTYDVLGEIYLGVRLTNSGAVAATNVTITDVMILGKKGYPLPQVLGTIGINETKTASLWFPSTLSGPGVELMTYVSGTYAGGSFSDSKVVLMPTCAASLPIQSSWFPATGGTYSLPLNIPGGCSWTVSNANSWISVSPASGVGPATITYRMDANPGTVTRTGQITVGGQTFTAWQVIGACPVAPSFTSSWFPDTGGVFMLSVSTPPGCAWTATSDSSWIQITASGSGPGVAGYTIVANPSRDARSGRIMIGGVPIVINQVGR